MHLYVTFSHSWRPCGRPDAPRRYDRKSLAEVLEKENDDYDNDFGRRGGTSIVFFSPQLQYVIAMCGGPRVSVQRVMSRFYEFVFGLGGGEMRSSEENVIRSIKMSASVFCEVVQQLVDEEVYSHHGRHHWHAERQSSDDEESEESRLPPLQEEHVEEGSRNSAARRRRRAAPSTVEAVEVNEGRRSSSPAEGIATDAHAPQPLELETAGSWLVAASLLQMSAQMATALVARRCGISVFITGASGSGKSTLAALLASQLCMQKVIGSDNVRGAMRCRYTKDENPILYSSTYDSYKHVHEDSPWMQFDQLLTRDVSESEGCSEPLLLFLDFVKQRMQPHFVEGPQRASIRVLGYLLQCATVFVPLFRVVWEAIRRRESFVAEGVHFVPAFVEGVRYALWERGRRSGDIADVDIVAPMVVHIPEPETHRERFATRSANFSLKESDNKYVRHFQNIQETQTYLLAEAVQFEVSAVDNTNFAAALGKALRVCHKALGEHETQHR